jgi:CBS domain-containing protein
MSSLAAKDVFSKLHANVHENDTLSKCLAIFKEKQPPVLIVFDSNNQYRGVISRRWILRSRMNPSTTKVSKLTRPAPTVDLRDSLSRVARLMIESGIRQLPVYSGEQLLGTITDEDVIYGAVRGEWGDRTVEKIMTTKPSVVEEDESVGALLSLFREQGISHAPVTRNGELTGMVSIHDVIEHIFQPRQRQTRGEIVGEKLPVLSIPVKGIMTKPVITVLPNNKLKDCIKKMRESDISSLVVVRKKRPIGIVTKLDFLEPIAQQEEMKRRKLRVQFSISDVDITEDQQSFMRADFDSFARKYEEALQPGTLFVYLKAHGTNYKGDQLIHCRLQLRTWDEAFFSASEGWGVEATFQAALDKLDKQILRSKKFEHDPEFARTYLRRIRFPLTEL